VINWERHRLRTKDNKVCNSHSAPLSHAETSPFWQKVPFLNKTNLPTGFDPKVSVHLLDEVKVYRNPEDEALKVKYVFSGSWCLSTGCRIPSP